MDVEGSSSAPFPGDWSCGANRPPSLPVWLPFPSSVQKSLFGDPQGRTVTDLTMGLHIVSVCKPDEQINQCADFFPVTQGLDPRKWKAYRHAMVVQAWGQDQGLGPGLALDGTTLNS